MRIFWNCQGCFQKSCHHAVSCDFLPTEAPGIHYQGDVKKLLDGWEPVQYSSDCMGENMDNFSCQTTLLDPDSCQCIGPTESTKEYKEVDGIMLARPTENPHWDLMIAHPPCTYLASSGLHWNKRIPGRDKLTEESLEFVRILFDANIKMIALENPIGRISTAIRKPDQIIQPWMFGEDASKSTCLWLKNIPELKSTNVIKKQRYANQTASGQNKLAPSADRWKIRSKTYQGIADAMAQQWGGLESL